MNSDGLIHFFPHELGNKLVSSFATYDGKDGLVIVGNDPHSPLQFSKYPRHKEVAHLSMDDIRSSVARLRSTNDITQSEISSSMSHDDYTQEEVKAAGRIQYFWRSRIPKVKQRRQHMLSAEARAVQFYIDMGSRCAAPVALRGLLISRAATAYLKLPHLQTSIAEMQANAMSQVMEVEVSNQLDEKFDIVVRLLKNLEKSSETAVDLISEDKLARNLTAGAILKVKNSLKTVEKSIESVEAGLLKAKTMIEEMFENVA